MTLLLGILTTRGAWVSSDHGLYDQVADQPYTEPSSKQLHMRCKDGSATLAYTGVGRFLHPVMGRVDVSDWVRRFLRARNLGVDESIRRLIECADRRLGPLAKAHGMPHHFAVVAFIDRHVFAAEVSNVINGTIEDHFDLRSLQVTKDGPIVLLAGFREAVSEADVQLLQRISGRVPARSRDYSRVLAEVNRRAAARSRGRISASCETTYIPVQGEPFDGNIHDEAGQEIPAAGTMIFSVDMTDVTRAMSTRFRALTSRSISHEEFERLQKDALDESVKVEDC